ncbi:TNT domain-containing protein [Streptomyces sp. GC420]|uniref:TNT domain-containing protein n=1 Tax=Streptomyces sp. GC420 TaxID=2697568 RepID=UPI0014150C99|nr:TNT domain-containing protein [Streptomyces sp. GC420]NBM17609.1 glycohydrolase toxin TNT-related protein [Streptomyces sp. GC420]
MSRRRLRFSLSALPALFVLVGSTLIGALPAQADTESDTKASAAHRAASTAPADPKPGNGPDPSFGGGGGPRTCASVPFTDPAYFCGDPRLGPRRLPTRGVLGAILFGYDRLGGQTPAAFLATWWDDSAGTWKRPPNDGFDDDANGNPIRVNVVLDPGQKIDRFGSEAGTFLSPAGTPYEQRSIPPQNLNTYTPDHPYNYYAYKVLKPITVQAGPAAPFYGQPGQGLQYVTSQSVTSLLAGGYLKRLN